MSGSCSIRAIWILGDDDVLVFSRRFPVVEKRWRAACKNAGDLLSGGDSRGATFVNPFTDGEIVASFTERKKREESVLGFGLRLGGVSEQSDSWVDDPIMKYLISLRVSRNEGIHYLWPLALHVRGPFSVLVLPLVEPPSVKSYVSLSRRFDCGHGGDEGDANLSCFLLSHPCITGAFMVAHAIGDVITSDANAVSTPSPSVAGFLDSLTGRMRTVSLSSPSSSSMSPNRSVMHLRIVDRDVIQSFLSGSMPFGTPLDLDLSNISAVRLNGFTPADVPPAELKQPAWKPYLYRSSSKPRLFFTVEETIDAAMYDRDEIPDTVSLRGQVNCEAELEGLPDVCIRWEGKNGESHGTNASYHHCVHLHALYRQSITFSPPPGNFVLMRYRTKPIMEPPLKGFYQFSMVTENDGAFLFKLSLMDGCHSCMSMDFCTVAMPFHKREVVSVLGNPSVGSVSVIENSIEWKIIGGGARPVSKNTELVFSGTVRFAQLKCQNARWNMDDDHVDRERGSNTVGLDVPFNWNAFDYAKASFKITGASLSGMVLDATNVSIYPFVRASVEVSTRVTSGDYVLWNTLGNCPSVVDVGM